MTVRELISFMINNCDLDDTVRYDPENAIENINDAAGADADTLFVDGVENRDGYVWLYEEAGRRRKYSC